MIELLAIHIPKTAGQSFDAILRRVYGDEAVLYMKRKDIRAAGRVGSALRPETRVLHGHFHFSEVADIYEESRPQVTAWVRDPVERVVSNYRFFIMRQRSTVEHPNMHRRDEPLLTYAGHPECRNRMSAFLAGIELEDIHFLGVMEHFDEDLERLSRMMGWNRVEPVHLNSSQDFALDLPPVTEDDRARIRKLNSRDVALYEQALRIRESRRSAGGHALA